MRWLRTAIGVGLLVVVGACAQEEGQTVAEPTDSPVAAATASPGAAAVRTEQHEKFGMILVDAQGRTLYTFDRDQGTTVACAGDCATRWPPLLSTTGQASGGISGLGVVRRPDGNQQVTYKNKPLYRFSEDAKAGDVNGDGVGGVWHVAKVDA